MNLELRDQVRKELDAARLKRAKAEIAMSEGKSQDAERLAAEAVDLFDHAEMLKRQYERENKEASERVVREAEAQPYWTSATGSRGRVEKLEHLVSNWGRGGDPTFGNEYTNDFMEYIASRGRHVPRYMHQANREYRDLNLGSDAEGVGYLAPGDVRREILSRMPAVSEILNLVTPVRANGDVVIWPRTRPHESDGSIYTSAGVGEMVPEQPTANLTEQRFGTFQIPIKKARYMAKPTMDAIEDIPNLSSFLIRDASLNLGLLAESQLLNGSGIGNNVLGILNHDRAADGTQTENQIGTVDVEGTTTDQISNTTSGVGSAPKVLDLVYSVPAQYRNLSSFCVTFASDSEKRLRQLVDANGNFHWSVAGSFGAPADGFVGYKKAVSEFMHVGGVDGNRVMLAGALDAIIFATRDDIRVQVADQLFAESDTVGLFIRWRFGAGLSNTDAIRIGIV